jgi:hypothetical protein
MVVIQVGEGFCPISWAELGQGRDGVFDLTALERDPDGFQG